MGVVLYTEFLASKPAGRCPDADARVPTLASEKQFSSHRAIDSR